MQQHILLTILLTTYIHAASNDVTDFRRQQLIDTVVASCLCCSERAQDAMLDLYDQEGPWETSQCSCSRCPLATVIFLERNECNPHTCLVASSCMALPLLTGALGSSYLATHLSAPVLLNLKDSCLTAGLSFSYVTSVLACFHKLGEKKLLQWTSNPANWIDDDEQAEFSTIATED